MKLKYIFLVLFGIIIFLILNNIDTFNIGIPYKYIPPVDAPVSSDLIDATRDQVWNTRIDAQNALAQFADSVNGNINDNIIFIPSVFNANVELTSSDHGGKIKYSCVNVIGKIFAKNEGRDCDVQTLDSLGTKTSEPLRLKTLDNREVDISTTEFIRKLNRYREPYELVISGERQRPKLCVRYGGYTRTRWEQFMGYNLPTCDRYLIISESRVNEIDHPNELFLNTQVRTNINRLEILVPFMHLIFGQLRLPGMVMPNRFTTFFTGGNLFAFEISNLGLVTAENLFHMSLFLRYIMNGLNDDRILEGFDVTVRRRIAREVLSPISDGEIFEDIQPSIVRPEITMTTDFNEWIGYIKAIRSLINTPNKLRGIRIRMFIFFDWDTQFIVDGDRMGVFDFGGVASPYMGEEFMFQGYGDFLTENDIMSDEYVNLSSGDCNRMIANFFAGRRSNSVGIPVMRKNYFDIFISMFGNITLDDLNLICCDIHGIYNNMVRLGLFEIIYINKMFKILLYVIKHWYKELDIRWNYIDSRADVLKKSFLELENLLFPEILHTQQGQVCVDEGIAEAGVAQIAEGDPPCPDVIIPSEPEPESESEPDACAAIPHTTSDSS